MKKQRKQRKTPEDAVIIYRTSRAKQAKEFQRPLSWLNRILEGLIQVLESQLRHGAPITPGTTDLIALLKRYKKRAILEGFMDYFPESDYYFVTYYRYLESINRHLSKAKTLAHDRRACQAELTKAGTAKKHIPQLFLDYMGIEFHVWYHGYYAVDKILERTDEAVKFHRLTQKELKDMIWDLLIALGHLIDSTAGEDIWESQGDVDEDLRIDLKNMRIRLRFLLEQIESGDWDVDDTDDQARIRRILREVRTIKHRSIRRLGDYGGKSLLDWYKALFNLDYIIDNATDLWVNGKMLPEWDPEIVKGMIRRAQLAKYSFIRLFPDFLGRSLLWFYKELYLMDLHLDIAKDMMDAGQLRDAIRELRHVRIHKHRIERVLAGQ